MKFSIIIPVYNDEKTIVKCLDSIIDTNYKDKEIIVIDDASTDGALKILESYAEAGKIELIKLADNKGIAYASNVGLSRAVGDIIIRTDADTIVPQNWISLFMKYFVDDKIIAVGGSANGCLNPYSIVARVNSIIIKLVDVLLKRAFLFGKLSGANRAVRKNILQSIGGFGVKTIKREDYDLFVRLKKMGKIIFDPKIVVKTYFPISLNELWQRKFLWGQGEGERMETFSARFLFSFFVSLSSVLSIPIYMMIFLLGYTASMKEKSKLIDLLLMPFILVFSELAFFFGASKAIFVKYIK